MASPTSLRDPVDRERSMANLNLERDSIALYEGLASVEKDRGRATAFRHVAATERQHAEVWAERLRAAGTDVPPPGRPRWRVRAVVLLARLFGTRAVWELARSLEDAEARAYMGQDGPEAAAILEDERDHARMWQELREGSPPGPAALPATAPIAATTSGGAASAVAAEAGARPEEPSRGLEGVWHRAGQTGTLRAGVFGINDGLVSNLALVMGVAGASVQNDIIVLAGVAGLLAGAFSMGAGEYISVRSQRELFERRIELEREQLRVMPDIVEEQLATIYRAKGLPREEAMTVANRLMADPRHALDTKIREDLGIDPDELGSPWGAAISSFIAFSVGAIIPLAPFLATSGLAAGITSIALSLSALFLVGALVSLITGRGALYSGLRQAAIGGGAAIVTYVVGVAIGVSVGS
jgi:vacuolar iron transporter family protein